MRLMIVDDEKMTRDMLAKLIPWRQLGIEGVVLAADGQDALERAEGCPPDILLTDVRMPVMDGIGLAREFSRRYPQCKVLFLSGYSDKEYLLTAIQLKAGAYIEKPVDPGEVTEALRGAVAEVLDGAQACEREREFLGMLRRDFVGSLLLNNISKAEEIAARAGIPAGKAAWRAASMRVDGESEAEAALSAAIESAGDGSACFCAADGYAHVLSGGGGAQPGDVMAEAAKALRLPGRIGLACACGGLHTAGVALRNALTAARAALFFGRGRLDYSGFGKAQADPPDPLRDPAQAEAAVASACALLRGTGGITVTAARDCLFRLAAPLAQKAALSRMPAIPLPEEPGELWAWISRFETLEEAERALLEAARLLAAHAGRSAHIRAAMRYIDENLCDYGLSLTITAGSLNLNSSYLCTLFKEETGETFVQYLTNRRMERAKELLAGQRAQIRDIAATVGFADVTWFIKRFKQAAGMTPSQYRERYGP